MKWMVIALAVLVIFVALIAVIGSRLPRDHAASRSLIVRRTPQEVWTAVTQATAASSVPVDIVEQDPPRRLVTRVKESEKMFGGTWTIAIVPDASTGSGCTLTITERGWVANPLFRFLSRFVIGHHASMDGILKQVAAALNEQPVLIGE
jgi:hypothetical protein